MHKEMDIPSLFRFCSKGGREKELALLNEALEIGRCHEFYSAKVLACERGGRCIPRKYLWWKRETRSMFRERLKRLCACCQRHGFSFPDSFEPSFFCGHKEFLPGKHKRSV